MESSDDEFENFESGSVTISGGNNSSNVSSDSNTQEYPSVQIHSPSTSSNKPNLDAISKWKNILPGMRPSSPKTPVTPDRPKGRAERPRKRSFGKSSNLDGKPAKRKFRRPPKKTRDAPFYKVVEGTNFVVDGFGYKRCAQPRAFFLSHFHSDHYTGMNKSFDEGIIYCSEVTARLVAKTFSLPTEIVKPIPMNQRTEIQFLPSPNHSPTRPQTKTSDDTANGLNHANNSTTLTCHVTLLEANHCPGAVMFLFELPGGKTVLHVGDFRFSPEMKNIPQLRQFSGEKRLSLLYLDTTYCDPRYVFPPQSECLEYVASVVEKEMA
eukprot:153645_1